MNFIVSEPIRIVGIVRGREMDAQGTVSLGSDGLTITWPPAATWRLALDGIDGVGITPETLTLYLSGDDVLELSGASSLPQMGQLLVELACRVPELMRNCTGGMAVVQGDDLRWHDVERQWLAPLLDVRRSLQGVNDPQRQATLFDGTALADRMYGTLGTIAATVIPNDAARQRALEAAMEEELAPLFEALRHVAMTAAELGGGTSDTRIAQWRQWIAAARKAFSAADEVWREVNGLVSAELCATMATS